MTKVPRSLTACVAAIALFGLGSPVDAATKPSRLLVPAGASALYWSYSMRLPSGSKYGTIKITNPSIIEKVRRTINAIAVSNYSTHQACPMDYRIPSLIQFSRSTEAHALTEVSFELGGCPRATVFQNGETQRPTLGSWPLGREYAAIQKVIAPHGQPLA